MAKAAPTTNGKTKSKAPPLPKGFKELSSSLAGFFTRAPGNTLTGILRGSFETKGKFGARKVYRIEVTDGTTMCTDKEGDVEATPGDMIGIDETGYLKALGDLDAGSPLFLRCVSKGPSEKDPWVFQIGIPE